MLKILALLLAVLTLASSAIAADHGSVLLSTNLPGRTEPIRPQALARMLPATFMAQLRLPGHTTPAHYSACRRRATAAGSSPSFTPSQAPTTADLLGTLVFDSQGNGYGTASSGGANGLGVVYKLTPPTIGQLWNETVLYSFQGGTDGQIPFGEVVFDSTGNLYGTTSRGGLNHVGCFQSGCGTVFELSPNSNGTWQETVLHRFSDSDGEGAEPRAGLVFDAAGNLYGTTNSGGNNDFCNTFDSDGCGAVFELMPGSGGQWQFVSLGDFNDTDGGLPRAGVTLDGKGNLYGVTTVGGVSGGGTLFSLTQQNGQWVRGRIFSFPHNSEPSGNLIFDSSGNIYGTTYLGGKNVSGSVFQFSPSTWTLQTLYNFSVEGARTGDDPLDGVFLLNGAFFLTTTNGGRLNDCAPNPGCGAVVELSQGTPSPAAQ